MNTLHDRIWAEMKDLRHPRDGEAVERCVAHIAQEATHNNVLSRRLTEDYPLWVAVNQVAAAHPERYQHTIPDLHALVGFVTYRDYLNESCVPKLLRCTASGFLIHTLVRLGKNSDLDHYTRFTQRALYLDRALGALGFRNVRTH